ncbi:MAG: type II toxin-antitoxin system prevent-host-death family antitoxin [Beijerinckiaceae bacterium]
MKTERASAAWTVQEAKAHLSELLRRARTGEPQLIGAKEPCVLIAASAVESLTPRLHLGRMLIETAPHGDEIMLPLRATARRDPFADAEK